MGQPGQRLRRFDKVVDSALALLQVRPVDLVDAMRDPVHNQSLRPDVPQPAVDLEVLREDRSQVGCRGRCFYRGVQGRRSLRLAVIGCQSQCVGARSEKVAVVTSDLASARVTVPRPDSLLQATAGVGPGLAGGGVTWPPLLPRAGLGGSPYPAYPFR